MSAKSTKQAKYKKSKKKRSFFDKLADNRRTAVWYKRWDLYATAILIGVVGSVYLILTHAITTNGCFRAYNPNGSGTNVQLCVNLGSGNSVTGSIQYVGNPTTNRLTSGTVALYQCARTTLVCKSVNSSSTIKILNTSQPNIATITTPAIAYSSSQYYKACMTFNDSTGWGRTAQCTQAVDLSGKVAATTTTTTTSSQSGCGGQTLTKSDGSLWQCTFDEEFNGTSLDTTKWDAWNNVNYWIQPTLCYYNDSQHLSVNGGYLNLTVTRLKNPPRCTTSTGSIIPKYGSAIVNTKNKFSQTQGKFEARIKFAGGKGLHDDFWLYPEKNYYPGHAEIDIAEPYGALANQMNGAIHMTASDGINHPYLKSCDLPNWAAGFHTYSLEWTTTSINFSYDGKLCYSFTNWKPLSGYNPPAPFDQNFFIILQAAVDDGSYSPAPDNSTVMPVTMQVDWVRVWK